MSETPKPISYFNDVFSLVSEIQQKYGIAEKSQGVKKDKYKKWAAKLSFILKRKIEATEKLGIEMAHVRAILIKANRAKSCGNLELFSDLIQMSINIAEKTKLLEQILLKCSSEDILALLKENPERVIVFKAGELMKIKIREVKSNKF